MLGDSTLINIVDQEYIEIDNNALLRISKTTLVLSLLGRASLPENLRETYVPLEYGKALDVCQGFDLYNRQDNIQHNNNSFNCIIIILHSYQYSKERKRTRARAKTKRTRTQPKQPKKKRNH